MLTISSEYFTGSLNYGEGRKLLKLEIIIFNAFINKAIQFSPHLFESLASETGEVVANPELKVFLKSVTEGTGTKA